MSFRAKLRRIGNSVGIYIPLKVITGYNIGEEIELEVITSGDSKQKIMTDVITPPGLPSNRFEICPKHGGFKQTCGCR